MIKSDNIIKKSTIPKARFGVFAGRPYHRGEIIEINVFLEIPEDEDTIIKQYQFDHPKIQNYTILILGNISLINHSNKPNADPYHFNLKNKTAKLIAMRNILPGEELFINYGEDYEYHW